VSDILAVSEARDGRLLRSGVFGAGAYLPEPLLDRDQPAFLRGAAAVRRRQVVLDDVDAILSAMRRVSKRSCKARCSAP
jgi:hypothetical protein